MFFPLKLSLTYIYLVTLFFCVPNSEDLNIWYNMTKTSTYVTMKNNFFNNFSTVEFLFPITEIEEIIYHNS